MSYDALWEIPLPDPERIMLSPFEYVLALVGGTKRRTSPERFRALFPMRVRVNPEVYFAVAAHPLATNGTILTPDGPMTVVPDPKLRRKEVFIDAKKG